MLQNGPINLSILVESVISYNVSCALSILFYSPQQHKHGFVRIKDDNGNMLINSRRNRFAKDHVSTRAHAIIQQILLIFRIFFISSALKPLTNKHFNFISLFSINFF